MHCRWVQRLCIDIILSLNEESSAHEENKIPLGIDHVATTFLRSEPVIDVKQAAAAERAGP